MESTSRMAVGTVIYGISGDAVSRIRNTHGGSTSRPVAGPVIYGIFGDAAFGIGDTHEGSTNSFRGSVALSKIPWLPVTFSTTSRAKSSFSAGILNTIEKVGSRIAKVTCFTVENGPPSRPPRKWQHYRGFDHLGRWGP